ncbi:MAG TPA: LPXTG cell wall anchor domain-containing protein, partial [Jatrophihabitantaceae bacterium]|nr:LPXTG cell wall anchor domain-containing protein [Jatrophihabitantaceae bacterium]
GPGALTLGDATDVPVGTNDAHLKITNFVQTRDTLPPTVTPTSTSPSASPTEALANTGSDHVTPTTIAGIALVVLGGVMLFMARRPRRART